MIGSELIVGKNHRPRILIFAYACEPGRGSEPGAGWGLVMTIARSFQCVVLTGPEHIEGIRHWEKANHRSGLEFIEVSEPPWGRFTKTHRVLWFLLYAAWLREAGRVARDLIVEQRFDAVFHATYSAYWLPTPAVHLNLPSVWGPVGGAVTIPPRLQRLVPLLGLPGEMLDFVAVRLLARAPATRRTQRAASVVIAQNEDTLRRLPPNPDTRVLNHALFVELPQVVSSLRGSHLLWVSPMETRKGPRLVIQALMHTPDHVRLVMVGDGPQRRNIERQAARLGLSGRIEFLGWVERTEVLELLAGCAAAVFTGLREEGGLALAEAMLTGTPVIVLAHGGAEAIAGASTDPDRVALIEPTTLSETARRMGEAMTRFSQTPSRKAGPTLDQGSARAALRAALLRALATDSSDGDPTQFDVGR